MDDALWGRTTVGCNPKQTTTVPTPFTAVHHGAAVHAPTYQALMKQFLGHGYIYFPRRQQALAHLLTV